MAEQLRSLLTRTVEQLRDCFHSGEEKGCLYSALDIVKGKGEDIGPLLREINKELSQYNLGIYPDNMLKADFKVLDVLGFPISPTNIFNTAWLRVLGDEPNFDTFVMAAATIVQLYFQPTRRLDGSPQAQSLQTSPNFASQTTTGYTTREVQKSVPDSRLSNPAAFPVETDLMLGLVLKSKDRGEIDAGKNITTAELMRLVDGASYWLCSGSEQMAQVHKALTIGAPLPDPDSEQEILILVSLRHKEPLVHGQRFSSKFALKHYLGKGIREVHVKALMKASRFDELMSLGFDRA